jgi:hypothetical protein
MYELTSKEQAIRQLAPIILEQSGEELTEYMTQDLSYNATVTRYRDIIQNNPTIYGNVKDILLNLIPLMVTLFYKYNVPLFILERNLKKCIFIINEIQTLDDTKSVNYAGDSGSEYGSVNFDEAGNYYLICISNIEDVFKQNKPDDYDRMKHKVPKHFKQYGSETGLLPNILFHELLHLATMYPLENLIHLTGILYISRNKKINEQLGTNDFYELVNIKSYYEYMKYQSLDKAMFFALDEADTEIVTLEAFNIPENKKANSTSDITSINPYPFYINEQYYLKKLLGLIGLSENELIRIYLTLDVTQFMDIMGVYARAYVEQQAEQQSLEYEAELDNINKIYFKKNIQCELKYNINNTKIKTYYIGKR